MGHGGFRPSPAAQPGNGLAGTRGQPCSCTQRCACEPRLGRRHRSLHQFLHQFLSGSFAAEQKPCRECVEHLVALLEVPGSWQGLCFWKHWLGFSILTHWHRKDGAFPMQGRFSSRESAWGFTGVLPTDVARLGCKQRLLGEHWSMGQPQPGWDQDGDLRPCLPPSFPHRARGQTLAARMLPPRMRARAASAAGDGSDLQPPPACVRAAACA